MQWGGVRTQHGVETRQEGMTMARMWSEASFAAERWKGSVPTPTGGGAVSPRPLQTEM